MSIELAIKLGGLLIVIVSGVVGIIWGASKINSNVKSLKIRFDDYKEFQKEIFNEYKIYQKEASDEYKKVVGKEIKDIRDDTEEFGKKVHEHNKNTGNVINKMRNEEIIPATHDIKALFKSDEESKKDISEINIAIKEVSDNVHNMSTDIALLIKSENK